MTVVSSRPLRPAVRGLCAGALVLLCAACVTVNRTVLMDRSDRPVPVERVDVLLEDDTVPDGCERVAILGAEGSQDWTDLNEMIDRFREETGKLGGNLVQIRGIEEAGTGERIVAAILDTDPRRRGQAVAYWCPGPSAGGP